MMVAVSQPIDEATYKRRINAWAMYDWANSAMVTVVMPCYNGAEYIVSALDSAIAQTHKPVQIVVVDDGSKDDSAAMVRHYIAKHPGFNIELIQQANVPRLSPLNSDVDEAFDEIVQRALARDPSALSKRTRLRRCTLPAICFSASSRSRATI
ncbi:MAG: glycosyltransferase, partial [Anaerolineae bacterium]|nr:glycosyltransferase [Anaerolineae bacterium]